MSSSQQHPPSSSASSDRAKAIAKTTAKATARASRATWRRYRGLSRRAQIIVACVVLFLSCGFCGTLTNAGGSVATDTTIGGTTQLTSNSGPSSSSSSTSTSTLASAPTATNTPKPTPTNTPKPKPTNTPAGPKLYCASGVPCNPWGYNFAHGGYIYSPPSAFCGYFSCIGTFWNGSGYVVECADGDYSKSGGHRGSCSHHGGDWRALLS